MLRQLIPCVSKARVCPGKELDSAIAEDSGSNFNVFAGNHSLYLGSSPRKSSFVQRIISEACLKAPGGGGGGIIFSQHFIIIYRISNTNNRGRNTFHIRFDYSFECGFAN